MGRQLSSGAGVLEKCLAVFQRIAADRGATRLVDLAADLALPRATLYRMTGALAQAGMITRIKPGYFGVGLVLAENLAGFSPRASLVAGSRPLLRRLALACRATAHLGIMENEMVTYLVKETGGVPGSAASFTRENAQLEAYCSGIGKVLLAWLPADEQKRYLAGGPFVALTRRTMTEPAVLQACLAEVQARGFARDDGEIAENLSCLAVPLWKTAPMTAAISLSFGQARIADDGKYIARLRQTAAEICRRLGK